MTKTELLQEADLVNESFKFWLGEMDKWMQEADELEENSFLPDYESRRAELIKKRDALILKGKHEKETIAKLQKENNKLKRKIYDSNTYPKKGR